ncbi:MAG: xanthine dehydrogenase family protein molybdopterin-binding subunit [Pseudomonadota bacterium]
MKKLFSVGKSVVRKEALAKVTGQAQFIDDIKLDNMLFAYFVTSEYAHADILDLDISEALKDPNIEAVYTAKDIPGANDAGIIVKDQPLFVEKRIRQISDRIALVVGKDKASVLKAIKKVKVKYKKLPGLFDPEESLNSNKIKIHSSGNLINHMKVRKGNVDKCFDDADLIIKNKYKTPYQEHSYLETQGVVASFVNNRIEIFASCQCPFYIRKQVSLVLGIPMNEIKVTQSVTGGAFGGKEDYPSEVAAAAAMASMLLKRPVKIVLDREDDFQWSTKRHPYVVYHELAAKKNGKITGARVKIIADAGAYVGMSVVVSERANVSAIGPYVVPNVHVDTYTVYTNNLFTGPYRGFGAPQVTFACERQMDEMAKALEIDPLKFREINSIKSGSTTCTNQKVNGNIPCKEMCADADKLSGFKKKHEAYKELNKNNNSVLKGIGVASAMYGNNLAFGGQILDRSGASVKMDYDGSVNISVGLTEMGQGLTTVSEQMAAEAIGVPYDVVRLHPVSTDLVSDSGPTVASRGTIMSGQPLMIAGNKIKKKLLNVASKMSGKKEKELDLIEGNIIFKGKKILSYLDVVNQCFLDRVNLFADGWYFPPLKKFDKETGLGEAYNSFAFALLVADVEVSKITGKVTVNNIYALHDIGKAINPTLVEGQIEGGISHGVGYGLMEKIIMKEGRIVNPSFTDYLIPVSLDMPNIKIKLYETKDKFGPYGAKGIGEPSFIPVASAIANAVSHAIDKPIDEIPVVPEDILCKYFKL